MSRSSLGAISGARVRAVLRLRNKKPRKELERKIEKRCDKRAKERGWQSRKMNGLGFNHWPDRLYLMPMKRKANGVKPQGVLWVEFKRVGEEPTEGQGDMHRELRARGQRVEVIDNLHDFEELLNEYQAP